MELILLFAALGGMALFIEDGANDEAQMPADDPLPPVEPEDPDILPPEDPTPEPLFLDGSNGGDMLEGGALNDTIIGKGGDDDIFGGAGDDSLDGGGGFDSLFGQEGNDSISGGALLDLIDGGSGDDLLAGDAGSDTIDGGLGEDTILGGSGADTLTGDARQIGVGGEDHGNDSIDGGAGNDFISGNGGIDTLIGGDGNDTISDADLAFDDGAPHESFVDGGAGNDNIRVDAGSTVTGGAGADVINLRALTETQTVTQITDFEPGVDTLILDLIVGPAQQGPLSVVERGDSTGADVFFGDDLIVQLDGVPDVTLDDLEVRITLEPDTQDLDYVDGPLGNQIVTNRFDNVVEGGAGNDSIYGGGPLGRGSGDTGGNDMLSGGAGDDLITSSSGEVMVFDALNDQDPLEVFFFDEADTLSGGEGNDTLLTENGGLLTGGAGADTFGIFQELRYSDDIIPPPAVITDYNPAEDTIYIELLNQRNGGTDAQIAVASADDGSTNILSDGILIAQVQGGPVTLAELTVNRTGPYVNV